MNIPVEYHVLTVTSDGAGGTSGSWAKSFDFFARVEPVKGYRRLEYSQIIKGNGYVVTTRYRDDITNEGRLKVGDTEMAIHSVVNKDFRNKEIEIIADDGN